MGLVRASFRYAMRDLRASPFRAASTCLLLATAIAILYAAQTIATATRTLVHNDSRAWLGADIALVTAEALTSEQQQIIAPHNPITSYEAIAAITSPNAANPIATAIRAINPERYSFYSTIRTQSGIPLTEALRNNQVILSPDAAARLHVTTGDTITIGTTQFTIAALIHSEDDRLSAALELYPRLILSLDAFHQSGLAQSGIHIRQRLLFRHHDRLLQQLDAAFPLAILTDYQRPDPRLTRTLHSIATALDITAICMFFLGSLAAVILFFTHIERQLDDVAVLKTLGATQRYIIQAYASQILTISTIATITGIAAGALLAPILTQAANVHWSLPLKLKHTPTPILLSLTAGTIIPLLTALLPLHRLRRTRALQVLRRYMHEDNRRPFLPATTMWIVWTTCATLVALPQLLRGPVLEAGKSTLPYSTADLIILGLRRHEAERLTHQLRQHPATRAAETHPLARIRLANQSAIAACASNLAPNTLRISTHYAGLLQLRPNQSVSISGDPFTIEQIIPMDTLTNARHGIQLPCGYLQQRFPAFYEIAIQGKTDELIPFLQTQSPTAAILPTNEVRAALEALVHRAVAAFQFLTSLIFLAATAVLASIINSNRRRRARDIAICKSLGATNRVLLQRSMREFAIIGLQSALAGALLSIIAATLIQSLLLHNSRLVWSPAILLTTLILTPLAATLTGVLTVTPSLRRKPFSILSSIECR
ncbi:MAG: FtsX-like permease family protein [Acidobacteria bacterium]|nr:FtsX-like permease family protein [Acidobacteriota bacterium]